MQVKHDVVNGTRPTMRQESDPQVVLKAERRRFRGEPEKATRVATVAHW